MTKVDQGAPVPVVDAALRARMARALDREPVIAAYLFGSQARGATGPLSDIDVAVLARSSQPGARAVLRAAVTSEVGTDEVDLVPLERATPLMAHRVIRDGLLLVDRDPRARIAFQTRTLLDYLDTAPLRSAIDERRRERLTEGTFGRR